MCMHDNHSFVPFIIRSNGKFIVWLIRGFYFRMKFSEFLLSRWSLLIQYILEFEVVIIHCSTMETRINDCSCRAAAVAEHKRGSKQAKLRGGPGNGSWRGAQGFFFCFCWLCHPIGLDFSPLLITRGVWVPDLVSGLHATLLPNNLQPCLHWIFIYFLLYLTTTSWCSTTLH